MLRFDEGVSTSPGLTSAAGGDVLPKGDLVRFCVDFRVTCLTPFRYDRFLPEAENSAVLTSLA